MPDGTVTWGFVGAGGVARRRMLPAVCGHPEVRLGGVLVRDQARAEAIAAEFGAGAAYSRLDDLLADPAIEAVYIATPPDVHEAHVTAAAAAGKHILLEKPMALDVGACERMEAAAAAAGVRLAVCFPLRHTAAVERIRGWLQAGELGELVYWRAQLAKWYPLDPTAWRADPRQSGGGVVMDLGSHLLDLGWWFGGDVAEVSAQLSTRHWPVAVEDTAVLTVRHESGALGIADVSYAAYDSQNVIEVYGTRGYVLAPSPREPGSLRRVVDGQQEELEIPSVNVYARELLDFGRAVRQQRPGVTNGEDGRRNTALLTAAYRAAGVGTGAAPGAV